VIAKAILDMISLPTAAPRAAAQDSGQPFQAFSDSLIAASKSSLQASSTNDGESKSGHRQKADSDDAKTPDGDLAGNSAVNTITVLPAVPQQSEEATANVTALESPLGGLSSTDGISAGATGLFAQNLAAVGLTGIGSSNAQTSTGSTSIALPTGIQSSFTSAPTTAPTTSNVLSTGLAETQTSAFQSGVVQASNTQPMRVQSDLTSVQMPLAGSATTKNSPDAVSSQPAQDVAEVNFSDIQTSLTQINSAAMSDAPTLIRQPVAGQSKSTEAQRPVAEAATTQKTPDAMVSLQSRNVTVAEVPATQTSATPSSNVAASIAQPSVVPSKFTSAQISVVEDTKTQSTSSTVVSQPVRTVELRTAEPVETQSRISDAKVSQGDFSQKTIILPTSVQSSGTPASDDLSQSYTKLPVEPVQETTSSIATSPKSEDFDQSKARSGDPSAVAVQNNGSVQDSLSTDALNTISNTAQNIVVNVPMAPSPAPILHAALSASAKDVAAQALKDDTTVQTDSQSAVSNQTPTTTTTSVQSGISDQLGASPLSAGPFGVNQIGVSGLKPAAASKTQTVDSKNGKDSGTERTGSKKNAEPETEKDFKSSSQDATASGEQNQGNNDSQAQVAVPIAVNFTVHPAAVIAAAQNVAHVATNHTSSTSADAAGVGVKMTDNAASASVALPQALPVINTAKLIQSMGQSEMRVGMRSNEFGNISISTSTTHDQVSAQISLEHGELAKTLAAQLPEMQARLGGTHPMDVRIDMNGATTGQGTGTYGGTSHGSQDQSSNGRQQAGSMAASSSSIGSQEKQFSPVAAVMPTGYSRLDIRV
jgi:hypothetical protein